MLVENLISVLLVLPEFFLLPDATRVSLRRTKLLRHLDDFGGLGRLDPCYALPRLINDLSHEFRCTFQMESHIDLLLFLSFVFRFLSHSVFVPGEIDLDPRSVPALSWTLLLLQLLCRSSEAECPRMLVLSDSNLGLLALRLLLHLNDFCLRLIFLIHLPYIFCFII